MDISVIILTYQSERYLSETIESVLTQTMRPTEILISDDCSSDQTWLIVESYRNRYPDIIKTNRNEQNLGIGRNMNTALAMAGGDYVCFVAGDDRFKSQKLEIEYQALENHPECCLAYSDVIVIDDKGNPKERWDTSTNGIARAGWIFIEVFSKTLFPNRPSLFRNPLMRRQIINQIGDFDEALSLYEDWDYKIRITSDHPVVYTGQPLVEYRIHEGGVHNYVPQQHFDAMLRIFKKHKQLLQKLPGETAGLVKDRIYMLLLEQALKV